MILSVSQLREALEHMGGGDDDDLIEFAKAETDADGHSGAGIYVASAEYPDEGGIYLGPQA